MINKTIIALARALNGLLHPLGLHLSKRLPSGSGFTMKDALARYALRYPQPRTVVDLGAASGKWSLMAKAFFPKASWLLVDPLAEREGALKIAASKLMQSQIALVAAGAADHGEVQLTVSDDLDGSTVGAAGNKNNRAVTCRTVDSLVKEYGLKGPFFLKFDTHGFELAILDGCAETLRETTGILMEVYNHNISDTCLRFAAMCQHMESLGFRCLDLADPMLRTYDQAFWQMDLLFTKSDSSPFLYHEYN